MFQGKRFEVYYCHSYSAWEKGSNENANRLLRRFFPKGTDFSQVTQKEIDEAIEWLNNYPRKLLGWKSAIECYRACLRFWRSQRREGRAIPSMFGS